MRKRTHQFVIVVLVSLLIAAAVLAPGQVGDLIVPLPQRRLFARDLLARGGRTTQHAVYFVGKRLDFGGVAAG